jgi:CBS domain-containing protein
MSVGRICVREVWTAQRGESIRQAAQRMAKANVGTLVVLDDDRRPVGIVTDRDAMTRCVAESLDPDGTTVGAIMSGSLTVTREETPIEDALSQMAGAHVRRMPVVDAEGRLVGIVTLDDVIDLLAEEAKTLGRVLRDSR